MAFKSSAQSRLDWLIPKRIVMRDAQTYCAILLDDNNRGPLAPAV